MSSNDICNLHQKHEHNKFIKYKVKLNEVSLKHEHSTIAEIFHQAIVMSSICIVEKYN